MTLRVPPSAVRKMNQNSAHICLHLITMGDSLGMRTDRKPWLWTARVLLAAMTSTIADRRPSSGDMMPAQAAV